MRIAIDVTDMSDTDFPTREPMRPRNTIARRFKREN